MDRASQWFKNSSYYGYYMKYRLLCHNKLARFFIGEFFGSYCLFYLGNATSFFELPAYICSLVIVFGLGPLIEILSPISNGQLNTAISIAFFLRRGQTFWQTVVSIIAQFLGGLLGVLTLNFFFTDHLVAFSIRSYSHIQFYSEVMGSFLLMFVLMMVTYRKQNAAIIIPCVIAAGIVCLPSGMIVNPYMVICRMICNSHNNIDWQSCICFLIAEAVGFTLGFLTSEFVIVEGERDVSKDYSRLEDDYEIEMDKNGASPKLEGVRVGNNVQPSNEEIPMN